MVHYAEILDTCLIGLKQAMPDPGLVNLNTQKVPGRACGGLLNQCLAVAESDFEDHGGKAAKYGKKVQGLRVVLKAVNRPKGIECTLL